MPIKLAEPGSGTAMMSPTVAVLKLLYAVYVQHPRQSVLRSADHRDLGANVIEHGIRSDGHPLPRRAAIAGDAFEDVTALHHGSAVGNCDNPLRFQSRRPGDRRRHSGDAPALTDLNAYASINSLTPAQLAAIGDFDNSGTVTNRDIQGLLDLVASQGGGSAAAVPEPATLVLVLLAAAGWGLRRSRPRRKFQQLINA